MHLPGFESGSIAQESNDLTSTPSVLHIFFIWDFKFGSNTILVADGLCLPASGASSYFHKFINHYYLSLSFYKTLLLLIFIYLLNIINQFYLFTIHYYLSLYIYYTLLLIFIYLLYIIIYLYLFTIHIIHQFLFFKFKTS